MGGRPRPPATTGGHPLSSGSSPHWTDVAAGSAHTCAIRTDATLWCWGYNGSGQLGLGSHTEQDLPRQVTSPAPGGWASITAGTYHTCATRTDGTLWCWGWNHSGQLGLGSHTGQDLPRQVITPARGGWVSVAAGYGHTCATRISGTLWCWGDNTSGDLGLGSQDEQDLPQQVTAPVPGGWASVTAGNAHTCATRADGTLWCWGNNQFGELGTGGIDNGQFLPEQVTAPAPGGWADVTAGEIYTCATRTDESLWCWGWNLYGQLGLGSHTNQDLPRQVTAPPPGGWASTTAGMGHTCATRTDGTLWCWGLNHYGQLGIRRHADRDLPQQVTAPAPGGWADVTAGEVHTCAIRTDRTLWCWGWNHFGQLGIGNDADQCLPRQVPGPQQTGTPAPPARHAPMPPAAQAG